MVSSDLRGNDVWSTRGDPPKRKPAWFRLSRWAFWRRRKPPPQPRVRTTIIEPKQGTYP